MWYLSDTFRLVKYENGEFETFEDIYGSGERFKEYFLHIDVKGRLMFSNDKGFFRYENGQFVKFEIPTAKFLLQSTAGSVQLGFGQSGDVPLANSFVRE